MRASRLLRRRWKWLLVGVPVALAGAVVAGAFAYIHFVAPDPAPRLAFASVESTSSSGGFGAASAGAAPATFDGAWAIASGSTVQYRVQEVLAGQDTEATGSTTAVGGQLQISGTTVSGASFSVDMTKVSSGESRRDSQFRGRIMNTSQYPTATFELTSPIDVTSIPENLAEITVQATGNLKIHGTTKTITFNLKARRNGAHIEVNGSIPVTFSDYGISNPSGGPASVGDSGELEFLLVFAKS